MHSHLSDAGTGNPSSVHLTVGVGFPSAEHLSDTAGPGRSVWSMNV